MKTVYLYNADTGYYEGKKIIVNGDSTPANSTETPMELEYREHYLPTWTGEEWEYTENPNNPVPTPTPIPEPTPEEIKQRELNELDAQYMADKNELLMYYVDALVNEDENEQTAIKEEVSALNEQFDADYEAIVNGEEE